ncbi:MAG: LD-carboxypeptidase [Chloroflexota bacterium]
MIKPPALKPNDLIALIAPADRPREPSEVQQAKAWLEREGYRVRVGEHVFARHGYLAGTDAERLADFHAAWADDDVRAILCARGKWGASRLLSMIDFDLIAAHPKIFVGCGDITSLLVAIQQRTGLVTFHGPTAARLGSSDETRASLVRAITTSEPVVVPSPKSQVPGQKADAAHGTWDNSTVTFRSGQTTGQLLGGSLSALISLLGTPFAFEPRGALLFLEEADQRFSQFDRDLTTLRLADITPTIVGLVIGECVGAAAKDTPQTLSLEEIFAEQIERISAPACYGLPIGQGRVQHTLPIGVMARMDADAGTLELLESATVT